MKIIPVFLPESQCPYHCAFCDVSVSAVGEGRCHTPEAAAELVSRALATLNRDHPDEPVQIAFYGGTFTWGGPETMSRWLEAVRPFLEHPPVSGIRVSTRPDMLAPDTLDRMNMSGVTDVELGVQSFDDRILAATGRGHTAADARVALDRCRTAGFRVGIHLMTGFPFEDAASWRHTLRETVACRPDTVRIHPLLVLAGTRFHRDGVCPLPDDVVLDRLADALLAFRIAGIPVIRVGMQLESRQVDRVIAGLYHPALRHRVMSRLYHRLLSGYGIAEGTCAVHPSHLSYVAGFRRENLASRPLLQAVPDGELCPWGLQWRGKWYDITMLETGGEPQ